MEREPCPLDLRHRLWNADPAQWQRLHTLNAMQQPKYKQQIKRKATYNAYYYPDYHYQPIVDKNGNRIDWRSFHGEKEPEPVANPQLKLF